MKTIATLFASAALLSLSACSRDEAAGNNAPTANAAAQPADPVANNQSASVAAGPDEAAAANAQSPRAGEKPAGSQDAPADFEEPVDEGDEGGEEPPAE